MMRTNRIFAALTVAAFSMTALSTSALPVLAQETRATVPPVTFINVSGMGEVTVTPDVARITVGVQTRGKDSTQAATENANKTDAVIKAIKAMGVAPKDIQTAEYNIYPQFDYQKQPPTLIEYQVTNSVRITVRKLADAGKVLDAALKAGANSANGISFEVSDPQKSQDEALAKAVVDATRKAGIIAKASGSTVTPVLSEVGENSSGGVRPPMPMMMARKSDAGDVTTPVEAGETKITVTVTARFMIPVRN